METVWPAKPKVFAIWAFVGSLPTCGLDTQGDDSGVRTQLTEGQRHGLGGESYQWEGGASPEKRRSEERGSDMRQQVRSMPGSQATWQAQNHQEGPQGWSE